MAHIMQKVKVGDKVVVNAPSLGHILDIQDQDIPMGLIFNVIDTHDEGFIIDGGYYYNQDDISDIYTPEQDPEMFI